MVYSPPIGKKEGHKAAAPNTAKTGIWDEIVHITFPTNQNAGYKIDTKTICQVRHFYDFEVGVAKHNFPSNPKCTTCVSPKQYFKWDFLSVRSYSYVIGLIRNIRIHNSVIKFICIDWLQWDVASSLNSRSVYTSDLVGKMLSRNGSTWFRYFNIYLIKSDFLGHFYNVLVVFKLASFCIVWFTLIRFGHI